jgi:hypothetical protein
MLAVALVCELNKATWKDLLLEDGCTPRHKLVAAVSAISNKPATDGLAGVANLLNNLLLRAAD